MVDARFRGNAWAGLRFANPKNSAYARRRRYSAVVGTDSCESIAKAYGIVLRRNRQTRRRRLFGFDQARGRIHHACRLILLKPAPAVRKTHWQVPSIKWRGVPSSPALVPHAAPGAVRRPG